MDEFWHRLGYGARGAALAFALMASGGPATAEETFDPWSMPWSDPWQELDVGSAVEPGSSGAVRSIPTLSRRGLWPLMRAMSVYQRIAEWGGWPRVLEGDTLEPGMVDDRIPAIRQRLLATGDLKVSRGDPRLYGDDVEQAVRRFQVRHGLELDGTVGKATIASMNVSVEKRIAQIEANLDRLNVLIAELGQRYVFVNIAAQEVEAVEGERIELFRKVIVGKTYRQTPEINSEITYLVFNPFWNVPRSIARRDLVPKEAADPGHLRNMGIRVFEGEGRDAREVSPQTVDWSSPDAARYRLRQDPGRRNSLGTVKIRFPNPHSIYLHDTPSKNLFGRHARTYSSGCVRVEDIHGLTAWLLGKQEGWDRARIDKTVASGRHITATLDEAVPIYLVYLTAWVGESGLANFRDDVYRLDKKLRASALDK